MRRVLPLAAVAAWLVVGVPARHVSASVPLVTPIPSAREAIEPVTISTSDNLRLSGDFYAPRRKGRAPAAMLVHEAGSDRSQLAQVADRLHRLGFAVLTLDLRGHGGSANERFDWQKLEPEARERMWALTPRDLSAAADFLRRRSDVHTGNLSLVGLRSGAAVAVHYAADDQNARAVVLLDPQPESLGFNLLRDVERLGGLPTLIMAPSTDRTVAENLTRSGHAANGGAQFIVQGFLKGDSEALLSDKRLPREVADWLKGQVMSAKGDH